MKTPTIIIIFVLGTLLIMAAFVTHNLSKELAVMQTKNNASQETLERFSAFHRAMKDIGVIPYDSSFANCYDQSKLLTQKLAEANIKSSIIIRGDRGHSWVAVWIEATSGQFVPISEEEILEIRDGSDFTQVQCYNTRL